MAEPKTATRPRGMLLLSQQRTGGKVVPVLVANGAVSMVRSTESSAAFAAPYKTQLWIAGAETFAVLESFDEVCRALDAARHELSG